MKKLLTTITMCILFTTMLNAQEPQLRQILSQKKADPPIAIKTNLLYDLTATFNVGIEYQIAEKYTIDISANLNPWRFGNTKLNHFLLQPEVRWWSNKAFDGFFVGGHIMYGNYNVGRMNIPSLGLVDNLKTSYYDGYLMGAGISGGKVWKLSDNLNLEATLGIGVAYLEWDRYAADCPDKKLIESRNKTTPFPTKAGVSLVYFINR